MEIRENSQSLQFDANGLIPAIVQDHYTKEVLTLAYMNAETLALTIAEGRTVFWSRSRQEIWRKGETSGNVQRVVSITADCDKDALVVEVVKDGPACHTGAESCFFNPVYLSDELKQFTWQGLYKLIEGRKTDPQEGSYTTYLSTTFTAFTPKTARRPRWQPASTACRSRARCGGGWCTARSSTPKNPATRGCGC